MNKKKYILVSATIIFVLVAFGIIYLVIKANQSKPTADNLQQSFPASFSNNNLVLDGHQVVLSQWKNTTDTTSLNILASNTEVACLNILTQDSVAVFLSCIDLDTYTPLWEYSYSGGEGQYDYEYQLSDNTFSETAIHLNGDTVKTEYILKVEDLEIDLKENLQNLLSTLSISKPVIIKKGEDDLRVIKVTNDKTVTYHLAKDSDGWSVDSEVMYDGS